MFSVVPNIVLAPNMTQNAERKHRTQNTNTAHFKSWLDVWKCENSHWPPCYFVIWTISESFDTVAFVRILWCSCRVYTGFPRQGCQPLSSVQNPYIWQDFDRKLHQIKENGAERWEARVRSLAPLGSAKAIFLESSRKLFSGDIHIKATHRKGIPCICDPIERVRCPGICV